jgi:hypothetical protein
MLGAISRRRHIYVYANEHNKGQSLAELGILYDTLPCDFAKQQANTDQPHRLVSVSPANFIHALAKGIWIEFGLLAGGGIVRHFVGQLTEGQIVAIKDNPDRVGQIR